MKNNLLLSTLRGLILTKSGLSSLEPGECKNISEYIFLETKNYLSETTIKRFYGFANTQHQFSQFTLNTLTQYIGYRNWETFSKENINLESVEKNLWANLKLKAKNISQNTLTIKKNNSGIPFHLTAERKFYYPDFEYFLNSDFYFTTISAQPGQGKSVLIAHLAEKIFNCIEEEEKNDNILLIINSTTIKAALQKGNSINDFFFYELKVRSLNELIDFAKNNPTKCKGKLIIILDGLDDFLAQDFYMQMLVDFLSCIGKNDFIKVVLGLRTNTWANMQQLLSKSAFLNQSWYRGLFTADKQLSNVPALNNTEILQVLSGIEKKNITEVDVNKKLFDLFKSPFWLSIYYNLKQEEPKTNLKNASLTYELIDYFIEYHVFLAKKSTEKIWLLKHIANSISMGANGLRVSKEKILREITSNEDIYNQLIYSGLITEEKRFSTTNTTEIIRFLNYDIYTYIIFIQLLDKFDYKLNLNFFVYLLDNYKENNQLRELLFNWALRFCILRNQIAGIKDLFTLNISNKEKNHLFNFLCFIILHEQSKLQSTFRLSKELLELLISNKTTGFNYYQTLKSLSKNNLNSDYQLLINTALAIIYIFDLNKNELNNLLPYFKKNYNQNRKALIINPYDVILLFTNNLVDKKNLINDKIADTINQLNDSKNLNNDGLNIYNLLAYRLGVIALFKQKRYDECCDFIIAIFKNVPKKNLIKYSIFSDFILKILAQCYLKLEKLKKAKRIIKFLDNINTNIYLTNFSAINTFALKANFLAQSEDYHNALEEVNKAISLAEKQKHVGYIISMNLIKIDILKGLGHKENLAETMQHLIIYLEQNNIDMPDYVNILSRDNDTTFKVLKAFKQNN